MSPSASSVSPFSKASAFAAVAGAGGGLLSFLVGEIVNLLTGANGEVTSLIDLIAKSALWSGAIGLALGAAILVYDNLQSLRGQWHRDLVLAVPLFFALSFVGGAAGQVAYLGVQNSLTRGIGWALMGASVGVGIGLLRRDPLQAGRGAIGGALGGFIGGLIFNSLLRISDAGNGSFSRAVGQIVMGALIALLIRVVQDVLKSAWLLGISTGPYEGKEYPLNTSRVGVGRDDSNAIALYREPDLPATLGALVFQGGQWFWQGQSILLNGVPQTNAPLSPGDTLQLGATQFRLLSRSMKNPAPTPGWTPGPDAVYAAMPPVVSTPSAVASSPSAPTTPPLSRPTPRPPVVPSAVPPVVPPAAPPPPAVPAPLPSFALVGTNGQQVRLPDMSAPVSVGRTSQNQVVLADAGVSSNHARLQVVNGALCITDLDSTNGTFVNGTKLAPQVPHTLRVGDRLRLGQLDYTLRSV